MALDELVRNEIARISGPLADPAGKLEEVERRITRRSRSRALRRTALSAFVIAATVVSFVVASRTLGRDSGSVVGSGSPHGNGLIVYSATDRDGSMMLVTMRSDGSEPEVIARSIGYVDDASWSPDGSRLAYVTDDGQLTDHGLWVVTVADSAWSEPIRVAHALSLDFPAWSPDGSHIAFTMDQQVFVMDADGSNVHRLTELGASVGVQNPSWSPDGERIALQIGDQIWTMMSDGTDLIQIADLERGGYRPDWSPDGAAILFADRSYQLFRIAPDGSGLRQLTSGSIRYWDPTWSPDGTKIVAEGQPSGSSEGDRDIYVLDADGSNPTPITNLSDLGVAQSAMWADWQPISP